MKENITIHSVVDKNTIPFFNYLIENYLATATNPELLTFLCYCLDPTSYRYFKKHPKIARAEQPYLNPCRYRYKTIGDIKCILKSILKLSPHLGGSNGHAQGLNRSVELYTDYPGIQLIADSDTAMLQQGWDTSLKEILAHVDIFGAPYEDIGGFSSGNGSIQTYKDFPSGVWVALGQRLDWTKLDWTPAKERNCLVSTEEQSRRYGLPIGYQVVRDVGWVLPDYVADRNGKSAALEHVKPSSPKCKALQTGFDYHEEYQLNGTPFLGHHRGSRQFAFRNCEMSSAFYAAVESHLDQLK